MMPPPRRNETRENSSASERQNTGNEKKKSSNDEEEDRISSLPDQILHHILSFLDMKHVVQTSILSKRWKDLWASLGSLTFDSELFYSPQMNQLCGGFLNFVEQVLLLRDSSSNIQTFHFINSFQTSWITTHRLNTWIISVIKSKVKNLHIQVWSGVGLRLPNRLFTCNSLTRIMLVFDGYGRRWSITLPAADSSSMCLPNLLSLDLGSVSFNDENLTNKFFLSCPKLEELFLENVEFLHMNVNISALKLEHFQVENLGQHHGYCHWPNTKFKLHAPNLSYFICEDYMSKDYTLEDLTSLVKADIDMKVEEVKDQNPGLHYSKLPAERKQIYAQRMMQFLRALHYVKDLKLSAWFLEVVSRSLDLLEGVPTELCDLTCLRVKTWLSVDTIRAIAYMLKISPNIQSLFLEISQVGSENEGSCHLEAEMSFQCSLDKLEIVEIQGAVGCADELNFLEVLLKNAKALKKLVVCTSTEPSPDSKKRFRKFSEKFLMFPRASSNISILFY